MRIFFYLFILLFLNITITLSAGELKINVTNIKINIGSIHYALYDDPSFFPDEEGKIDGGNKRIDEVVANGILIKELNESYYAVAIYHDENSNKKFDKSKTQQIKNIITFKSKAKSASYSKL